MDAFKNIDGDQLKIRAYVYRIGSQKDSIKISWGDGESGFIPLAYSISTTITGVRRDYYYAKHYYDSTGYYELALSDGPLIDGVINIPASGSANLTLKDSIWIDLNGASDYANNITPHIGFDQTDILFENGIIRHSLVLENDFSLDEVQYEITEFPALGFSFPEATDSIYLNGFVFEWDRPIAVGTYAIGIKLREFRPWPPGFQKLMSTTIRAMMIDVDSSMIVSISIPSFPAVELEVFPNPTTDYLYIQATGLENNPDYQLILSDLQGRILQEKSGTIFNGRLQDQVLDVGGLPSGIYQVLFRFDGYELMKRVVVE